MKMHRFQVKIKLVPFWYAWMAHHVSRSDPYELYDGPSWLVSRRPCGTFTLQGPDMYASRMSMQAMLVGTR